VSVYTGYPKYLETLVRTFGGEVISGKYPRYWSR